MSKIRLVLLAMVMISALAVTLCDSTDTDAASVSLDHLEFSEEKSADSVTQINEAAGTTVCTYSERTLTFTKDTDLIYKNSNIATDFLTFKDNITLQIKDNARVDIIFNIDDKASDPCSAIHATGGMRITGNGSLYISLYSDLYPSNICCIKADDDITFDGIDVYVKYITNNESNHSTCLSFNGSRLEFKDCKCTFIGDDSGIRFTSSDKIELIIQSSELKCSGKLKAIDDNGKQVNITYKGQDIYASKDTDASNPVKIEKNGIFDYKYVRTTMEPTQTADPNSLSIEGLMPYTAFLGFLLFFVIFFYTVFYRHGGYSTPKIKFSDTDTAQDVMGSLYEDSKDQIKDILTWSNDDRDIKINVSTDIKGGSYALLVDGVICGHITSWTSEIAVPKGEHAIIITTNDANNILLFNERVLCQSIALIRVNKVKERPTVTMEVKPE